MPDWWHRKVADDFLLFFSCEDDLISFQNESSIYLLDHIGTTVRCAVNQWNYLQFTLDVIDFDCKLVDLKLEKHSNERQTRLALSTRVLYRRTKQVLFWET